MQEQIPNERGQFTDVATARTLQTHYVCARCYGKLIATAAQGSRRMVVACINSDCNGQGFVTRTYADNRRSNSGADYQEAMANLGEIMGLKKQTRAAAEILEELGV